MSEDTAMRIIAVVSEDPVCCSRIKGPTLYGALSRLGIAGHVRNFALLYGGGMSAEDAEFIRVSCVGITLATAKAIYNAANVKHQLKAVTNAYFVDRVHWRFYHNATKILMKDGTSYVFDWFPTLDPDNPVIYKFFDWKQDRNGVKWEDFYGFR